MKRKFAWYLILSFFIVGFLACGDSDDEQETQPTPTTQTQPTPQPGIALPKIDVDAERAAIQELLDSHAEAIEAKKISTVMNHWVKSKKVFIVHDFGGVDCTEAWDGVKGVFEGRFQRDWAVQTPELVEEVGIDRRGTKATIRGTLVGGGRKFTAAVEKNNTGKWKFLAFDPYPAHKFDHCKIKWIETPK